MEIVEGKPRIYNLQLEEQPFSLMELMSGIPDHPDIYIRRGSFYLTGIKQAAGFFAFRHNVRSEDNDEEVLGALADRQWSAIISQEDRKATLIPAREPKGCHYMFLAEGDSWKAKLGPGAWWYYTGGLAQTLTEFYEHGWTFDSVKHCSSREEYLEKYLKQENEKNDYYCSIGVLAIITRENLTLEQVLQTISQKP